MPLLKCIECGNDVSTYAEKCPYCGCPVSLITEELNRDKLFDIVVDTLPEYTSWITGFICQTYNVGYSNSLSMIENLPFTIARGMSSRTAKMLKEVLDKEGCESRIIESNETEEKFTEQDLKKRKLYQKYQPVKCPRCGSTSVTTTSRGYSLVWGFAGSNKTVNRCGKCGFTWNP